MLACIFERGCSGLELGMALSFLMILVSLIYFLNKKQKEGALPLLCKTINLHIKAEIVSHGFAEGVCSEAAVLPPLFAEGVCSEAAIMLEVFESVQMQK